MELRADTPQRWAHAPEHGKARGRFVRETGREIEVYVTDVIRAVEGNLERMVQLGKERLPTEPAPVSPEIGSN